jgi:hypothetical protein
MVPYDDPEFWNPKVRLPLCLNPPAARSHLPLTFNQTELAFSGMCKTNEFVISASKWSDGRAAHTNVH